MHTFRLVAAAATLATLSACGRAPEATPPTNAKIEGPTMAVVDSTLPTVFAASGTAQPIQEATLSTKLMGSVTAVLVTEGQRVSAGTPLARIDASDLDAKTRQADAGAAAAEAMFVEATAQARRVRALYADSAAPKATLDAMEAGLARAKAGLDAAKAAQSELGAVKAYGVVKAPFAGVVTHRFVDVGAFAAPGAPLMTVQDPSRLRVQVAVPAAMARALKTGARVMVRIEGVEAPAVVEGVVPTMGTMYTINAIVANSGGTLPAGGAATVDVPTGSKERVLLVPTAAIVREGDLTGVRVAVNGAAQLRWVRLGATHGTRVSVLSGLSAGEQVVLPTTTTTAGR